MSGGRHGGTTGLTPCSPGIRLASSRVAYGLRVLFVGLYASFVGDRRAFVAIIDNGAGIDPADAERLFTPFFSSKPTGQGIGLTLAREVLDRHGATYRLATHADGQTVFAVAFPPATPRAPAS